MTVSDTPAATRRISRRVRLAAIVVASGAAICCLVWILLPASDSHPVPSSVVKVKAALADYYSERGRHPRDLAEIEPYLNKRFREAKCVILRTGESEYRISIDKTRASYRFHLRYRVDDHDHVEVFEVRLD